VATVTSGVAGDAVEFAFARSLLGNPTVLNLFFLGDSAALGGTALDTYPNAALDSNAPAQSRSFSYTPNSN
jgi:hypothetical protein